MQLGIIGLGRMGSDMARRLMKKGHACVVHDIHAEAVNALEQDGATGRTSLVDFVSKLSLPRIVWMMLPTAVVDQELAELRPLMESGDIIVDGGNSFYRDDIRRAADLKKYDIHYVDVGTSGGVAGLARGYCLMVGGDTDIVGYLNPIFSALASGIEAASRTPGRVAAGRGGTAEQGFLHCGAQGAGHFVKMVHNGIEYGVMAAYAEGFNILRNANVGKQSQREDAETTPLQNPEFYQYEMDLPEIAEVWRRGSVIESWLLDLAAAALLQDPKLEHFSGRVSDSGEGRWTIAAAVDEGVPVPVISAALFARFSSRENAAPANRVLSAMRKEFGGHDEEKEGR